MKKLIVALVALSSLVACGGKGSPTAPGGGGNTTPPPVTPPSTRTLQSVRLSNGVLTIPNATTQMVATGTFSDGSTQNVTCAGWSSDNAFVLTVSSSGMLTAKNSGASTVGATCQGMYATSLVNVSLAPAWSHSGTGAAVFDMPRYITRVRIVGTYRGRCENFILDINSRNVVNEILGTCSVADSVNHDGTYLVPAGNGSGIVTVESSTGITWTITELR